MLLGLAVRVALVLLSGRSELQSDEANYVYLALAYERFGVLLDQQRYLWPPFYPWLLGQVVGRLGSEGALVVHLLQTAASGVIGASVGLLAWRLGSRRAALCAVALWAVHLPLAAYTHLLWSEVFFLALFTPALERLVAAAQAGDPRTADRRLLAAGLLLGASLLVKSFALYLVPALALLVGLARARRDGPLAGLRGGSLALLAAGVVVLPWGLRNQELYGRFVPSGATLGENAYVGVNAHYMNFDYVALRRGRLENDSAPVGALGPAWLVAPPTATDGAPVPPWPRADEVTNTVLRQEVQLERAADYARAHPGWFLRTRLKRLADLCTPASFCVRHAALGRYADGPLGRGGPRQALVVWAFGSAVLVLLLAALGLARGLRAGAGALVLVPVLAYVGASSLVLSMSRVRLPAEPVLLVLAALALTHALEPLRTPRRERATWTLAAALVVALVGLWLLNARELAAVAADALRGGPA